MAYTSRKGLIAEFKTGYLQREIMLHQCVVNAGTDESVYDATKKGYIVGRIVKITESNGIYTIASPADTTDPLADGTHIIAQSDNTLRSVPEDYIPTEKYTSRYDGIVKNSANSTDYKPVAVYKIVNKDDIKLVDIK